MCVRVQSRVGAGDGVEGVPPLVQTQAAALDQMENGNSCWH